jgi:hypothetical protein
MNDLDNELGRTMRRHAENLSAAPLAFDDVRGKATSIRRRRQLATGIGALAAVAVIVPTAMFASQNLTADNEIDPGDTATPTVTDSNGTEGPGPTMGADSGALDVAGLPTGAEPGVGLLTSGMAVFETGEATVRLDRDGEAIVVTVETDAETFGPYASSTGLTQNQAATTVAWATDDGAVMAWADGESEPFVIARPDSASLRVAAVTGTDCTRQASDCTFYVSGYDMATGTSEVFTLTSSGEVGAADPDGLLISVRDATDDGRIAGYTEINELEATSCSAVLQPAESGSTPLWETCNHSLDAFSPDGGFVLASDPYHSGIGAGRIAIYDARTGELLADRAKLKNRMAFYNAAVWEDETHVLFTAYQDGQWSIVRMDLTGAMEYAVEPQDGDEMAVPWQFVTR